MRDNTRRNAIFKRFRRDLTVAAVILAVVLAGLIPEIASKLQDLSVSGRQKTYEMEEVRISSDNALLAERLRMIAEGNPEGIEAVEIDRGNVYDRETAREAVIREIETLCSGTLVPADVCAEWIEDLEWLRDFSREISENKDVSENVQGDELPMQMQAFMVAGEKAREPFIIWACEANVNGRQILAILDETSGKLLMLYMKMEEFEAGYGITIDGQGNLASWLAENEENWARSVASYYGLTCLGLSKDTRDPYSAYCIMGDGGAETALNVMAGPYMFAVNTPADLLW